MGQTRNKASLQSKQKNNQTLKTTLQNIPQTREHCKFLENSISIGETNKEQFYLFSENWNFLSENKKSKKTKTKKNVGK